VCLLHRLFDAASRNVTATLLGEWQLGTAYFDLWLSAVNRAGVADFTIGGGYGRVMHWIQWH